MVAALPAQVGAAAALAGAALAARPPAATTAAVRTDQVIRLAVLDVVPMIITVPLVQVVLSNAPCVPSHPTLAR